MRARPLPIPRPLPRATRRSPPPRARSIHPPAPPPRPRPLSYDVVFEPDVSKAEGRRNILDEGVGPALLAAMPPKGGWCYDGNKNVYTTSRLAPPTAGAPGWEVVDDEKMVYTAFAGTKRAVKITFGFAKDLAVGEEVNAPSEAVKRQSMAVIDLAMRQHPQTVYKCLGAAFYDERKQAAWARGTKSVSDIEEMWMGFKMTNVSTAAGPMMQIDRAATAMLAPMNLLEFIAKKMKKQPAQVRLEDCRQAHKYLTKSKKLWSIQASHNPKRAWKLRGFHHVSAAEDLFDSQPKENQGEQATANMISIVTYFRQQYNIELKHPHLPCVLVGKASDPSAIRLPLELCSFLACQPAEMTPTLQGIAITTCAAPPAKRFGDIKMIHEDLAAGNPTQHAFQITTGPTLVEVDTRGRSNVHPPPPCVRAHARVHPPHVHGHALCTHAQVDARQMTPAKIAYRTPDGQQKEPNVNMSKGEWNLRWQGPQDLNFQRNGQCRGWQVRLL